MKNTPPRLLLAAAVLAFALAPARADMILPRPMLAQTAAPVATPPDGRQFVRTDDPSKSYAEAVAAPVPVLAEVATATAAPAPSDSTATIITAILGFLTTLTAAIFAFLRDRNAKTATVLLETVVRGTEQAARLYGERATVGQVKQQIASVATNADDTGKIAAALDKKVQDVTQSPFPPPAP